MRLRKIHSNHLIFAGLICLLAGSLAVVQDLPSALAQQPTPNIPTVTSTPGGPLAITTTDQDQINVRSGPSLDYPRIGVLLPGTQVPVVGRTPGGDWVQVIYPGVPGNVGWVFSPLLIIPGGVTLPIIEPPPTPTPAVTPTINPTLAAQFIIEAPPTRLPTFTPPPALVLPTFESGTGLLSGGLPMGLPIVVLLVIGVLGLIFSLLNRR